MIPFSPAVCLPQPAGFFVPVPISAGPGSGGAPLSVGTAAPAGRQPSPAARRRPSLRQSPRGKQKASAPVPVQMLVLYSFFVRFAPLPSRRPFYLLSEKS